MGPTLASVCFLLFSHPSPPSFLCPPLSPPPSAPHALPPWPPPSRLPSRRPLCLSPQAPVCLVPVPSPYVVIAPSSRRVPAPRPHGASRGDGRQRGQSAVHRRPSGRAQAAQPSPRPPPSTWAPAPAWEGGSLSSRLRTCGPAPRHVDTLTHAHGTHAPSVLSLPPAAVCPAIPVAACAAVSTPPVPSAPWSHVFTCAHTCVGAVSASPRRPRANPACVCPARRYARPPAHPRHRPGGQHRAPQSQRWPQVLPGVRGERSFPGPPPAVCLALGQRLSRLRPPLQVRGSRLPQSTDGVGGQSGKRGAQLSDARLGRSPSRPPGQDTQTHALTLTEAGRTHTEMDNHSRHLWGALRGPAPGEALHMPHLILSPPQFSEMGTGVSPSCR